MKDDDGQLLFGFSCISLIVIASLRRSGSKRMIRFLEFARTAGK